MSRVTHVHDWITGYHHHFHARLPGMLVMVGPASSGTTTLLTAWLASLTTAETPSLLAHRFVARQRETPAQVARRLCTGLGVPSSVRSATDLWHEVSHMLLSSSLDLLIIDQAECLSLVVCQCLRDTLVDRPICSLLLVSTPSQILHALLPFYLPPIHPLPLLLLLSSTSETKQPFFPYDYMNPPFQRFLALFFLLSLPLVLILHNRLQCLSIYTEQLFYRFTRLRRFKCRHGQPFHSFCLPLWDCFYSWSLRFVCDNAERGSRQARRNHLFAGHWNRRSYPYHYRNL